MGVRFRVSTFTSTVRVERSQYRAYFFGSKPYRLNNIWLIFSLIRHARQLSCPLTKSATISGSMSGIRVKQSPVRAA